MSDAQLKNTLNGVRLHYMGRGLPNPLANNYKHYKQMRGIKRVKGDHQVPKLPITMSELTWLAAGCDTKNATQVACVAACLIAFFAFLRKSNVTTGRTHNDHLVY